MGVGVPHRGRTSRPLHGPGGADKVQGGLRNIHRYTSTVYRHKTFFFIFYYRLYFTIDLIQSRKGFLSLLATQSFILPPLLFFSLVY